MTLALVLAGVFVLAFIAAWSAAGARSWQAETVRRVQAWSSLPSDAAAEAAEDGFLTGVVRPRMRRFALRIRRSEREASNMTALLLRCGLDDRLEAADIYALQIALLLSGVAIGLLISLLPALHHIGMLIVVIAALLGWRLPVGVLQSRARQRQNDFQKALPDMLDTLAVSVEAGLSFDAALVRVAEEFGGVVTEQVSALIKDMKLGRTRASALRRMAERIGLEDVHAFVAAMVQADQLGSSIGGTLKTQAESARTKRKQRAQERAAKTPVQLIFPIVLLILPAIFLIILTPAAISLMQAFRGGH